MVSNEAEASCETREKGCTSGRRLIRQNGDASNMACGSLARARVAIEDRPSPDKDLFRLLPSSVGWIVRETPVIVLGCKVATAFSRIAACLANDNVSRGCRRVGGFIGAPVAMPSWSNHTRDTWRATAAWSFSETLEATSKNFSIEEAKG